MEDITPGGHRQNHMACCGALLTCMIPGRPSKDMPYCHHYPRPYTLTLAALILILPTQSGEVLCHTDRKKLEWYLSKGIADKVSRGIWPGAVGAVRKRKNPRAGDGWRGNWAVTHSPLHPSLWVSVVAVRKE